jgi:hypothetical protein
MVDPKDVEVTGPALAVGSLDVVPTESLALWGLRPPFQEALALRQTTRIELPNGESVDVSLQLGTPTVVVTGVQQSEEVTEREIEGVPVEVKGPLDFPYDVTIEGGPTVVVRLVGPGSEIRGLEEGSVSAYVDLGLLLKTIRNQVTDMGPHGRLYSEDIRVALPPGISRVTASTIPSEASVRLTSPAE